MLNADKIGMCKDMTSNSPELNLAEHPQDVVIQRLIHDGCTSQLSIQILLLMCWYQIPQGIFRGLVECMPWQLGAV